MSIGVIFHYAIDCIFIGALFTLIGVGLLFFLVRGFYKNYAFSPMSFGVAIILFFLLTYQSILMCGAIKIKNLSEDVRITINQQLPSYWSNDPQTITPGDSQELLDVIVENFPLVGQYLNIADFQGYDTTTIANAMVDEINSYMNKFIWKRIAWSLLFICIGVWGIIKTMNAIKAIKRSTHIHARPRGNMARSNYIHKR